MDRYALVVAGGSGKRMGTDIPKQFMELAGKPILMHTISRFREFDKSLKIIVVIPKKQFGYWDDLQKKHSFKINHIITEGGDTRFFSVRNGLRFVADSGLVAIHDGVRPLVSTKTIERCFDAALKYGNAIPAISPADSIRMTTGSDSVPVKRDHIKQIQTPQIFHADLIKRAYLQEYEDDFTDDATVLEKTGERIILVEGNRENIKITTAEDLTLAEVLLASASSL